MLESILSTIKHLLGIVEDYPEFDKDILVHINSVFSILNQLGCGEKAFVVKDNTQTWKDFLCDKPEDLEMIKTFVFIKVKLIFDPPASGVVMEAYNNMAAELEWRIYSEFNYRES